MRNRQTTDVLSWLAAAAGILLVAWRTYWMNIHQIGAHSNSDLAWPIAVMMAAFGIALVAMLFTACPPRFRLLSSIILLLLIIVGTRPWEMFP